MASTNHDDGIGLGTADAAGTRFAERLVTETPWLGRRLRRFVPSHTADDVAHEAVLRAWVARDSFDDTQPLRPWLLTIARRVAIDEARRMPPSAAHTLNVDVRDSHWETDPEAQLDRQLHRAVLVELLDALPDRHRRVLAYRYEHGFSFTQIADLEDSTTTALKPLVSRARRSLRESYDSALGRLAGVLALATPIRRAQNARWSDAAVALGTATAATAFAFVALIPSPQVEPPAQPSELSPPTSERDRPPGVAREPLTEREAAGPITVTEPPVTPPPAAPPAPPTPAPAAPLSPISGPEVAVERTPETFAVHHDESLTLGDRTVPGGQGHIVWDCPDARDMRPHCLAIRALADD